jgi:hypothetical protein
MHHYFLCLHHCDHQFSFATFHSKIDRSKSLLWGTVRIPHSRALSTFFYYKEGEASGEKEQLTFLKKNIGNQLRQMRKRQKTFVLHDGAGVLKGGSAGLEDSLVTKDPRALASEHIQKRVLKWYDFVAVTGKNPWPSSSSCLTAMWAMLIASF